VIVFVSLPEKDVINIASRVVVYAVLGFHTSPVELNKSPQQSPSPAQGPVLKKSLYFKKNKSTIFAFVGGCQ
jgi:hypothetical protein